MSEQKGPLMAVRLILWAAALSLTYVGAGLAITLTFDMFEWWTALLLAVIVAIPFGSAAAHSLPERTYP